MNSRVRFLTLSLAVLTVTGCGVRQPKDDASQGRPSEVRAALLSHEKLLAVRRDQFKEKQPSPQVISDVISTLDQLLRNKKDSQAGTRSLACGVLRLSKSRRAIPVLLKALEDPYEKVEFSRLKGESGAHVEWYAVWRDADDALREITGANPISQPGQRFPIKGQRESVLAAWAQWWKQNAVAPEKSTRGPTGTPGASPRLPPHSENVSHIASGRQKKHSRP